MKAAISTILSLEQNQVLKEEVERWTQRQLDNVLKLQERKKSMTQEDLAARINISPTHVSVIERGTKIPRIDTFVAIANVLEVSADELLVDVVDRAATGVASNLSAVIEVLPHEEKMRVLKVVSALIDR